MAENLAEPLAGTLAASLAQTMARIGRASSLGGHESVARRIIEILSAIRGGGIRIHAITSPVAQPLTANGLLALGVTPSLTLNAEEIHFFAESSHAMLLNLGMLDRDRFDLLPEMGRAAAAARLPLVIDPVFADRSPRRRALARELFAAGPALVKLNATEAEAFERHVPAGTGVVVTGAVDRVTLGRREVKLGNGHPLMARVTATGCLGGAILAAALAVAEDPFEAAIAALSILNIAAEIAGDGAAGPGSFAMRLIDALHALDAAAIEARLKLEMVRDA